jgi:4-amino-4-deoxychorismate lyase
VGKPPAVLANLGRHGPELADPRGPFLRADDLGALRGDGIFERFLVHDGRPRHLDQHLSRLARSARMTDLDMPPEDQWRAALDCAIGAFAGPVEWEARLVCTRGPEEGGPPTAYVLGQALPERLLRQRRDGVSVAPLCRGYNAGPAGGEAPWLLLGAKTLSYAVNVAARRYAVSLGADDALFVGPDGDVLEGPTSSVVACFGRRLASPPASVGILDSISTACLLSAAEKSGWEVARPPLTLDDLFAADGVWLSSSLALARVHTLAGKALPPAPAHQELAALAALC